MQQNMFSFVNPYTSFCLAIFIDSYNSDIYKLYKCLFLYVHRILDTKHKKSKHNLGKRYVFLQYIRACKSIDLTMVIFSFIYKTITPGVIFASLRCILGCAC